MASGVSVLETESRGLRAEVSERDQPASVNRGPHLSTGARSRKPESSRARARGEVRAGAGFPPPRGPASRELTTLPSIPRGRRRRGREGAACERWRGRCAPGTRAGDHGVCPAGASTLAPGGGSGGGEGASERASSGRAPA